MSAVRWTDSEVREAWRVYQQVGSLRTAAARYQVSTERLRCVFVRSGLMVTQRRNTYHGCCPVCGRWGDLAQRTGWCHRSGCESARGV